MQSMIPQYSEDGKTAIPAVAGTAYDLFVFFEDTGAEDLYEGILEKLGVNLTEVRVVCLSGKSSLLAHREQTDPLLRRKILYVVDKDFDDLLGELQRFKDVYYLERYSIENYLLEDTALLELANEERPKWRRTNEGRINLPQFVAAILPTMSNLAGLYLIAQEFNLPISNTSEPMPRRSEDRRPWIPCALKIADYHNEIASLLAMSGAVRSEAELDTLVASRIARIRGLLDIPGKQLVDLFRNHISNQLGIRAMDTDSFCYRLASKCRFDALGALASAILAMPRNQ
jgi:hypothetical protein